MSAQHTPAPWIIIPARPYDGDDADLEGSYYTLAGIEGADGNPVCVFGDASGSGTMFENEADHRLISVAPDMLEALKDARELVEIWAAYADDYFREKHGLADDLARIDAVIFKAEGRSNG